MKRIRYLLVVLVLLGVTRLLVPRAPVWHEIVNDVAAITYCPLCQSVFVFDRNVDGAERTFGVSGLLYNSNVLLYDRETESLWSQAQMRAVSGPAAAATNQLTLLPSELTSWGDWKTRYPSSQVRKRILCGWKGTEAAWPTCSGLL